MENLSFGQKLQSLRKEYHIITLDDIVDCYNAISPKSITKSAISLWEHNARIPSIENIKIFADIFCISLDGLLNRKTKLYDEEIINNFETILLNQNTSLPLPKEYQIAAYRKENYTLEERATICFILRFANINPCKALTLYEFFFN